MYVFFTSKIKNEKNLILISNLLSFYTSNIIEPGKESIYIEVALNYNALNYFIMKFSLPIKRSFKNIDIPVRFLIFQFFILSLVLVLIVL